jgi:NifU-like protein involved in Fe-S cluster formation
MSSEVTDSPDHPQPRPPSTQFRQETASRIVGTTPAGLPLYLRIKGERIADISFQASCAISTASASMLTDRSRAALSGRPSSYLRPCMAC